MADIVIMHCTLTSRQVVFKEVILIISASLSSGICFSCEDYSMVIYEKFGLIPDESCVQNRMYTNQ